MCNGRGRGHGPDGTADTAGRPAGTPRAVPSHGPPAPSGGDGDGPSPRGPAPARLRRLGHGGRTGVVRGRDAGALSGDPGPGRAVRAGTSTQETPWGRGCGGRRGCRRGRGAAPASSCPHPPVPPVPPRGAGPVCTRVRGCGMIHRTGPHPRAADAPGPLRPDRAGGERGAPERPERAGPGADEPHDPPPGRPARPDDAGTIRTNDPGSPRDRRHSPAAADRAGARGRPPCRARLRLHHGGPRRPPGRHRRPARRHRGEGPRARHRPRRPRPPSGRGRPAPPACCFPRSPPRPPSSATGS